MRATYHWHDEYADVTIARRWTPEPGPYWTQVHLSELLERSTEATFSYDGNVPELRALEAVFARGAALLRDVAPDQLEGRNLELLDDMIANRPHLGVPGLDFPVTEPWASSQEGLWFTTDFSGPPLLTETIEASRSPYPTERAIAALRLRPGLAKGRGEAPGGL